MSQTTVNLGHVPVNRGEYSSSATYYKDNIVQYNGSSYICNVTEEDISHPTGISGITPYDSDPASPNTGWAVFANDSSGAGEGVYNVSVDHTTDNQPKIYASLSAALNDIPAAKKKGGMEIRFIFNNSNYAVDKEEGITTQPAGTLITSSPTMVDGTYKASQLLTYFSTLPTATGAGNAVVYYKEVDGTYTTWTITLQSSDNKYVQHFLTKDEWSANPEDWEKMNLEEEVSQLGQKLGEFQAIENALNGSALSRYINTRGEDAGGGGYFYSRPFPISKGDTIKYVGVGDGCSAISLCDNVPTFPVTPVVRSIYDGQTYTYEYTAESDGYYLISGLHSGFVSLSQKSGDSVFALISQNSENIAQNTEDIAQNTEDIAQLPTKIYDNIADNLIDINAIEENKYVKYDTGGIYSLNGNSATDFIPVNEDDELSFINVFMATSDVRGLTWYNTRKNNIEGIQYDGIANDRKIIVPKGARYLRATISSDKVSAARIIRTTKAEQVDCTDLLINTLCIGDSLTSGSDYTTGTYLGNMKENYPYYLKKISHINVDYVSRAGWSAKDWWRDYSATDFSAYDSFVIWLGTNEGLTDTLDDDVTPYSDYDDFANTNTGCYCKIISKMIEQTPNARIFLVNCYGTSGNLAITNSVIQKIAELYPNNVVGIIDMVNSGLWDESNRYFNHIINNIHFSRVGNLFLANYIYKNIKKLIYSNLQKFNFLILNYDG